MPEHSVTAVPIVYEASWLKPVWGEQRRVAGLFVNVMGKGGFHILCDPRLYSLWSLRTKNGIKILIEFNPCWLAREFCHMLVELGEDFIIKFHDLLHGLLGDCESGFLQTCHYQEEPNTVTVKQKVADQNT